MRHKPSPGVNTPTKPRKVASAGFLSALLLFGQTAPILGNPTGGQVVAGNAGITSAGNTVDINQSSDKAIINWQSFSIANGEATKFLVPNSSSATLNRVLGGNPSSIYGSLQSNGQLFLVNPNGIVVGASGRIDTAGFLGSTLDLSNDAFLAKGDLHFIGSSGAGIENQGVIHASSGDVYLIANHVSNSGVLSAPQGNVGLAAGSDVLLQQAGDEHLFIQPGTSGAGNGTGVSNTGSIQAATAELRAAGGNAYALAINNTGNIAATGFKKVNGQVYLTSDGGNITNSGQISARKTNGDGGTIVLNGHGTSSKGTVLNSGQLIASGVVAGARGGAIQLLGNQVGITDHGTVDVSGDAGGGTALVGGDTHGTNPAIPDADQTYLGPDAQVTADALTHGDGGKIVLWGNETTQAYGKLSVRGGALSGNGGFVETSAPTLDLRGIPDTSAPHGKGGTWLLDPSVIFISDAVSTTAGFNDPFTIISGSTFDLNQDDLRVALENGNVTLDASGGSGGNGTITWQQFGVNSQFDISNISGNTLTLNAPAQIPGSSVAPGVYLTNVVIQRVSNVSTGSLNLQINNSSASSNVQLVNSLLQLGGGDLTVYGTGFASVTDSTSLNNSDGIYLGNDLIDAQGGSISFNGKAGYFQNTFFGPTDVSAGTGLNINHTVISTSGTGTITLLGDASMPANGASVPSGTFDSSTTSITGVDIDNISAIAADSGAIHITGLVNSGTGNANNGGAPINGVIIQAGSSVKTFQSGGSVMITGDTFGSFSNDADNIGVQIKDSGTIISVAGNGSVGDGALTINGNTINSAGGEVDLSGSVNSGISGDGVSISEGATLTATGAVAVNITGYGATVSDPFTTLVGSSGGVDISTDQNANINITSGSGNIIINGTAGATTAGGIGVLVAGTNGFSSKLQTTSGGITINGHGSSGYSGGGTVTNRYAPNYGVAVVDRATLQTGGTGIVALTGSSNSSNSYGVAVERLPAGNGFDSSPSSPTVTAGGAFKATTSDGTGIYLYSNITAASADLGSEVGSTITSGVLRISNTSLVLSGGNFTAYGLGNAGSADGIDIDNSTIETQGGTMTILGQQADPNAYGLHTTSAILDAGNGAFNVTTLGGSDIWLNGTITAHSANLGTGSGNNPASITSGSLQIEQATITLSGGDLIGYGAGDTHSNDGIDVYSSTINTQGGNTFLTGRGGYYFNGSAPAPGNTSGWGVFIGVNAVVENAASNQNITTGNITITGDGSLPLTVINDLTGVEIFNSRLSVVDGNISVTGKVNNGTAQNIVNMYVGYTSGVGDGVVGVLVDGGATIAASGTGSVTLNGDTSGSVSDASGSTIAAHDNSGVHVTGSGTTISAASGGVHLTGVSGSVSNNTGPGASKALDVSVGPFQSGGIPTLNAGTGTLTIDPIVSSHGINVVANISAAITSVSDSGQEVDLFNNASTDFGILNLTADMATVYQSSPIRLGAVMVNNLTLMTHGDITQVNPITVSLLSAAAGGSITLIDPSNNITQLGQINHGGTADISSGGTPLTSSSDNPSQSFPFTVNGISYTLDLTQPTNIPALGITIAAIGNSTGGASNIGGGTMEGQQVATVLPVNNQVAPNSPDSDTTILPPDSSTQGDGMSYNSGESDSPIFQNVALLSGASSGDSDVGPGDVVSVEGGTVNSTKAPPAVAQALNDALDNQVKQDLTNAMQGH